MFLSLIRPPPTHTNKHTHNKPKQIICQKVSFTAREQCLQNEPELEDKSVDLTWSL